MSDPTAWATTGSGLVCDEYSLTMAQSFFLHRQDGVASFEVLVRSLPPDRGYLVVAGLEQVVEWLLALHFREEDLAFLCERGVCAPEFAERLRTLRFTGSVEAIPEGTCTGAGVPLLRVTAPRVEASIVEGAVLAIVNHQTMVASKAARVVDAARGRPVWDFSLRRLHGPAASIGVARAAYLAGCAGTATVAGGLAHGIPTTGTMAHHYVLAFGPDGERRAFEQFLGDFPDRATLLVDTYDTVRGVDNAMAASRAVGVPLGAVRLDSGDLAELSRVVRRRLDSEGFRATRIVASNDLDEHRIERLLDAGAPIDSFGVGTQLGTSADAPALGGVYKLVAQEARGAMAPTMKLSADTATDPGEHQVWRRDGVDDTIGLLGESLPGRPLMRPAIVDGVRRPLPSLEEIREHCAEERRRLPEAVRRIESPESWPVRRSDLLLDLRRRLAATAVSARRA